MVRFEILNMVLTVLGKSKKRINVIMVPWFRNCNKGIENEF